MDPQPDSHRRFVPARAIPELWSRLGRQEDLRAPPGREKRAVLVEELALAEHHSPSSSDHAALGSKQAGPGRAQELNAQIRGQEGLVIVQKRPARPAHRTVENRSDQAAVDNVTRVGRERVLLTGLPLDDLPAGLPESPLVAKRAPDVR